MSSIRSRIERLERIQPPVGVINWDSVWQDGEIVSDGLVDWAAMLKSEKPWSPEDCPIERAIKAVENGTQLPETAAWKGALKDGN